MTKTSTQTYQVLDDIAHVRQRTGMYAGSTSLQTTEEYVFNYDTKKMEKREISYIPAFIKIFSEILDNAIDEGKRAPDVLDTIKVDINQDTGVITIADNGRGIPVEIHAETGKYIAETIFSNLRAGSNFNDEDDQSLIGTNGVGSTISSILSSSFQIESCDGKKLFKQEFTNGLRNRSEPRITTNAKNHTKITFKPDYEFFKLKGIDADHYHKMVKKVIDAAACNTRIKFYINGIRVAIKSFEDYISFYNDQYFFEENDDWKVGITHSDGFDQVSFVNSVETYRGGLHVDYIANQVVTKLREYFKKKHKVELKPGDIKAHLCIFISCNVNRPKFSSQTKENMISPMSDWKTSFTVSDKMINKLTKSPVIQAILDWVEAKAKAADLAAMRALNNSADKVNLKKIAKFHDATERNRSLTSLFLCEGDSALSSILGARDPKLHAAFPLRGRPINVSATTFAKIKENAEFENVRTLIGLKYGVPADIGNLNFGKLVVSSDADEFGNSIAGLIINMFYRLWPEIVTEGLLYRLVTPVVMVEYKKKTLEFFTEHEFEDWRNTNKNEKYEYTFLKGLGSSSPAVFENYMQNLDKYLVKFDYTGKEDDEVIDLCFLKDTGFSDKRKEWLDLE